MGKSLCPQDGDKKNSTKNEKAPNNKRLAHKSKGDKPTNPYIRPENRNKIGVSKRAKVKSTYNAVDRSRGKIKWGASPNKFGRKVNIKRDGETNNCFFHHDYNQYNNRVGSKLIHNKKTNDMNVKGLTI